MGPDGTGGIWTSTALTAPFWIALLHQSYSRLATTLMLSAYCGLTLRRRTESSPVAAIKRGKNPMLRTASVVMPFALRGDRVRTPMYRPRLRKSKRNKNGSRRVPKNTIASRKNGLNASRQATACPGVIRPRLILWLPKESRA
jgi:hypothetical protein